MTQTTKLKRGAIDPAGSILEGAERLDALIGLFVYQVREIYDAERRLIAALPKMAAVAEDQELASALSEHLEQTKVHLERLDGVFASLDVSPGNAKCMGMTAILQEGEALTGEDLPGSVRDAALIAAGQRVEHYEMATYGTLRAFAEQLGLHDAADLLDQTLQEEGAADVRLSRLAERRVNAAAMQGAP